MKSKKYGLTVILGLLAGLAGGIMANNLFWGKTAFAEKLAGWKKVVAAEEFRLMNSKGEVLSTWGMYAGGPGIVLFSKAGEYRAVFSLTSPEEGPVLTLADKLGNYRAIIGLGAERQPYIALRDQEGKERLSLTLNDEGEPALMFYGKDGKKRAMLSTVDLTKMKRTGHIEKGTYSALVLFDEKGKIVWKAP